MRFGHLRKFLAERLVAQGIEPEKAPALAGFIITFLKSAGVITEKRVEAWESDAQIYTLRANGVPHRAIMESHGLGRSVIFSAVKRYLDRKRIVERAREPQPTHPPLFGDGN